MKKERVFTVTEGLAIQKRDLETWKYKLNAEVYSALKQKAMNHTLALPDNATGYDVFRGQSLLNFVCEYSR